MSFVNQQSASWAFWYLWKRLAFSLPKVKWLVKHSGLQKAHWLGLAGRTAIFKLRGGEPQIWPAAALTNSGCQGHFMHMCPRQSCQHSNTWATSAIARGAQDHFIHSGFWVASLEVWLELLRWTGQVASDVHFFSSKPRVRKHNNSKDTNDAKNSKDRTLGDLHSICIGILYLQLHCVYASLELTIIMMVMFQTLAFLLARSSRRRRPQRLKRLRKWMQNQQAMEGNPRGCGNFTVSRCHSNLWCIKTGFVFMFHFSLSAFLFRLYPCLRSPQTSACCQDADIMGSQRRKKLSFTAGWDIFACSCPGITSIQQSWITDLGINLGFTGHFLSPPTSCRRCFVQKVCQFSTGNMSHLSVKFGWWWCTQKEDKGCEELRGTFLSIVSFRSTWGTTIHSLAQARESESGVSHVSLLLPFSASEVKAVPTAVLLVVPLYVMSPLQRSPEHMNSSTLPPVADDHAVAQVFGWFGSLLSHSHQLPQRG